MSLTRLSNTNFLDLPNCVGLSETGKCFWLNITSCQGSSCSFQKTNEDKSNSMTQVQNRLMELDENTQERISQKYYNGKRPWKE